MTNVELSNQERRTRRELLVAASRLLQAGRKPSMDEVAEEALVSRATVYRYFPSVEALLNEAPLEGTIPAVEEFFSSDDSEDPEVRIDKVEEMFHDFVYRNEPVLRHMLAYTIPQDSKKEDKNDSPIRQNRRSEFIRAALEPARDQFDEEIYQKLCAALAVLIATESMIVFRDVLQVDKESARQTKSWACKALVRAALKESANQE